MQDSLEHGRLGGDTQQGQPTAVLVGDAGDAAEGEDAALLQTRSLGRDIIFTADMTVAVVDVAAAGVEATRSTTRTILIVESSAAAAEPYQKRSSPILASVASESTCPCSFTW